METGNLQLNNQIKCLDYDGVTIIGCDLKNKA